MAAAPVRIIVCPPHDAIGATRYVPQYRRQQEFPVHLPEHDADGTFERGLSFDEFQHCNVFSHKGGMRAKCLPIPTWTLSDSMTRAVVLRYMERRTNSKPVGSDRERLVRVLLKMKDSAARLTARLDRMCNEYVSYLECSAAWCMRRRKILDLQIKVLDGRLIFCARPDLFYSVVIGFYRTRLMSREIGEKHGISSECVRTILSRMNTCARELGYDAPQKIAASPEVRRMRKAQREAYRTARAEERRIYAEQQEAARQYRMREQAAAPKVARTPSTSAERMRRMRGSSGCGSGRRKTYTDGLSTRERWKASGKCVGCGGKHGVKREGKLMCAHCAQAFARRAKHAPPQRKKAEKWQQREMKTVES